MSVGVAIAWSQGQSQAQGLTTAARVHAWLGWGVVAAGGLQVLRGWSRGSKGGPTDVQLRGDHFDMTPRRIAFERGHKTLGYAVLAAAAAAIGLGLFVSDAPRWMPAVLPLIKLRLAAASIFTFRIAWNEFILVLVLTDRATRTRPVAASLYITDIGVDWGKIMALGSLIAIPPLIFTFIAARQIITGLTAGAVKG